MAQEDSGSKGLMRSPGRLLTYFKGLRQKPPSELATIPSTTMTTPNNEKEESLEPKMTLQEARAALQRFVSTPESSISNTSSIDNYAGLSTEQIRTAAAVIAENLTKGVNISQYNDKDLINNTSQQYKKELQVRYSFGDNPIPNEVRIIAKNKERTDRMIHSTFMLKDGDSTQKILSSYADRRPDLHIHISAAKLEENFTLENFRLMLRGARWLFANLLTWNDDKVILPEELDTHFPPIEQNKPNQGSLPGPSFKDSSQ